MRENLLNRLFDAMMIKENLEKTMVAASDTGDFTESERKKFIGMVRMIDLSEYKKIVAATYATFENYELEEICSFLESSVGAKYITNAANSMNIINGAIPPLMKKAMEDYERKEDAEKRERASGKVSSESV